MSKLSYLLVLLSLATSNIYVADCYLTVLNATILNQMGYNNRSYSIDFTNAYLEYIDPNTFIGYNSLYQLSISSSDLTTLDLEAFKGAVNLGILRLSLYRMNKFTNTKNLKFPYLTELTITYNNLTSLNKAMFNAFPALKIYNHGGYSHCVRTVDVHTFESLPNLTKIDLNYNLITSFEYLQIPKKLKELNLYGNKMNYFALSRTMGVLESLNIASNLFRSFKSMDFTFLANLTELRLGSNPHAYPNEIPGHLKPLVKLRIVDLSFLNISLVDLNFFKNNTKLQEISLIQNKISSLDNQLFTPLNDLRIIRLDGNTLTKISSGTFYNNPNLQNLDLRYNQISQIENSSFYGNGQTTVVLLRNQLTKIFPRTFVGKFYQIDFMNNQIAEIENSTFNGVIQLNTLTLSYNQIGKIAPGSFNNLGIIYLYLDNNIVTELKAMTFTGLSGVQKLDLSNNKIENIEPGTFNNVTFTYFSDIMLNKNLLTKLRNMTFTGINELRILSLSNNKIEEIEPGTFDNLNITNIYLDSNRLTAVSNKTFVGLNRVESISLFQNNISTIEPGTFAGLQNLKYIQLGYNQLTQLDSSMFAGSNNLEMINLAGNTNLPTANLQSLCPPAATKCQVYY